MAGDSNAVWVWVGVVDESLKGDVMWHNHKGVGLKQLTELKQGVCVIT